MSHYFVKPYLQKLTLFEHSSILLAKPFLTFDKPQETHQRIIIQARQIMEISHWTNIGVSIPVRRGNHIKDFVPILPCPNSTYIINFQELR